jgi:multidrug efflux pump subunit AcrB
VALDQEKLRQLGLTQTDVAQALNGLFDGISVTALRDGRTLIDVLARGAQDDRSTLLALQNLQLGSASGKPIPLSSFARLEWTTEQPIIYQRDQMPTITLKAAIATADQPDTIVKDLTGAIGTFAATLPSGYQVVVGGTVESSADSQAPILAVVPLMLLTSLTLVMWQMQSFRLSFIVFAVAPLGLIGVVATLLPFGVPDGLRRDSGRAGAGGHPDPQLDHSRHRNRGPDRAWAQRMATRYSRPRTAAPGRSC